MDSKDSSLDSIPEDQFNLESPHRSLIQQNQDNDMLTGQTTDLNLNLSLDQMSDFSNYSDSETDNTRAKPFLSGGKQAKPTFEDSVLSAIKKKSILKPKRFKKKMKPKLVGLIPSPKKNKFGSAPSKVRRTVKLLTQMQRVKHEISVVSSLNEEERIIQQL